VCETVACTGDSTCVAGACNKPIEVTTPYDPNTPLIAPDLSAPDAGPPGGTADVATSIDGAGGSSGLDTAGGSGGAAGLDATPLDAGSDRTADLAISTGGVGGGGGSGGGDAGPGSGGAKGTGGAGGTGGTSEGGGLDGAADSAEADVPIGTGGSGGPGGKGGAIGTGGTLPSGGIVGTGTIGTGGTGATSGTGGTTLLCPGLDCSNPNCTSDVCVDSAMSGWTGPIELYEGPPATLPTCSAPFSSTVFTLNANLNATPATCSTCSCGGGSVTCRVTVSATGSVSPCGCNSGCSSITIDNSGICGAISAVGGNPYFYLDGPGGQLTAGSCAVTSAPVPNGPAPSWTTAVRGCALPFPGANGCAAGAICSPIPKSPFSGKLCVYQTGDISCPSSLYTTKRVYYAGVTDNRSCSKCTCTYTGPNCSSLSYSVQAYSDSGCNNLVSANYPVQNCTASASGVGSFKLSMASLPSGSCAPSTGSGQPSGSVTSASPTTICCSP
jgi:hypothetical protein